MVKLDAQDSFFPASFFLFRYFLVSSKNLFLFCPKIALDEKHGEPGKSLLHHIEKVNQKWK